MSEWIKTSERMPDRDIDVEVFCSDTKERMIGFMERNEVHGYFRYATQPNGSGVYCKPTYWRHLDDSTVGLK